MAASGGGGVGNIQARGQGGACGRIISSVSCVSCCVKQRSGDRDEAEDPAQ